MIDKEQQAPKNDQEVDFEPLIAWFLRGTARIDFFLKTTSNSIKNNLTMLFVFGTIGFAIGTLIYFFAPKTYTSSVMLRVDYTDNQTTYNLINSLGKLASDNSYSSLANELKLDAVYAEDISSLEYLNFNHEEIEKGDTIVERKSFFIQLESYSNDNLELIEKALVEYIENQPYASTVRENRKLIVTGKIRKLEEELVRYDSLKTNAINSLDPRGKSDGLVFGEPVNPVEIFREADLVFQRLLFARNELKSLKSVKVIRSFIANEKATFPRLRVIIAISALFLLIGLISAYNKEKKLTSAKTNS